MPADSPAPASPAPTATPLSERDLATFRAIVKDMPGNPGMWHHGPLFERVLAAIASSPASGPASDAPAPPREDHNA